MPERPNPVVTAIDGISHTLGFPGTVIGTASTGLGGDDFGQTGSREELYEHDGSSKAASIDAVTYALP